MTNKEIARVFEEMAALLELKGENPFKIRAYQKAARSIELLNDDLEQMVRENRLTKIPAVGEAIEKKIIELVNTGRLQALEKLQAEFPQGVMELIEIPGVGPKTAGMLVKELGVKTVDELEAAIRDGRVASLPRMGGKTAENILRQIQSLRQREERIPIGEALPVVEEIIAGLKNVPGLRELTPAGSLRRFAETVGDIDIMCTADDPAAVVNAFTSLPLVKQVVTSSDTSASVIVAGALQVEFRVVEQESFGSMLQYYTGSKRHNINLYERARRMDLHLSEEGITDLATGKKEKFATEEAFYKRQGLQFIPPELREGRDEIEKAERGAIPRLIEARDIKGDLHVHTRWSEGTESLETMALAAKLMGYEYVAITDHSVGRGIAHGLNTERLRQQIAEIKELNEKLSGIRILTGVEVDIRADGSLDLPDSVLQELDIVVASVHSGMNETEQQMTARVIRAMENPNVDILGHPTCRIIPERGPVALDMEAVFQAALRTGTTLEINAIPSRLDLKDAHVYRTRELGVKLVVSTDSHAAEHLRFIRFGIGVARRGWCEAKDILNTRPLRDLLASLSWGMG